MSTWSYDGASVLSVTTVYDDAEQAAGLTCIVDEPNVSVASASGSIGATVTLTPAPGPGSLSPGDIFIANLYYTTLYTDADFGPYTFPVTKEARLFVFGTAGSGVSYSPGVVFGGTTVAVTLEIDKEVADGDALGPSPAHFGMSATDCNSTGLSEGSPGAQGITITRAITTIGHCDTSPFTGGESFAVQMSSFNVVFFYAKVVAAGGGGGPETHLRSTFRAYQ